MFICPRLVIKIWADAHAFRKVVNGEWGEFGSEFSIQNLLYYRCIVATLFKTS